MANVRVMPHGSGKNSTITVNGRKYTCALGSTIDVADFDAQVLIANSWVRVATVGTTAQRPAVPGLHMLYYDTTISAMITWDGVTWRNSATGALA